MLRLNVIISGEAPSVRNSLWLKPVDGGFTIYALFNRKWQPLKIVDDGGTSKVNDDVVQDLIGSVQDESSANTINGAKAYAAACCTELVGDATDATSNMTLYGLKNYIDAQIEALG